MMGLAASLQALSRYHGPVKRRGSAPLLSHFPLLYQTLTTRWRSGRDSNPRYAFGVYSLSRRAPSTTRPPLRMPARAGPLLRNAQRWQAAWVVLVPDRSSA